MNLTNAFGTITAILTALSAVMAQVLNCTGDVAATCQAAFLTPAMAAWAAAGFGVLTLILKLMRPGGALHSLFGATAVVVDASKAGPGTVTRAQVDSR